MKAKQTKKKATKELVYAEFDTEYSTWAIFGLDTGFCYKQPSTQREAEQMEKEYNESGGVGIRK